MVENFSYFTENNFSLELNLGVDVELFKENDEAKIISFYEAQGKGVKWLYQKKWINLSEPTDKLIGYPSADKQFVIIVYPVTSEKCPPPVNALVYNADGTVHMQLEAPEPVSKLPKDRAARMRKTKHVAPPQRLFFYGVSWAEIKGELVTVVKIGFDKDCWEERILNTETGKFGPCINTRIR